MTQQRSTSQGAAPCPSGPQGAGGEASLDAADVAALLDLPGEMHAFMRPDGSLAWSSSSLARALGLVPTAVAERGLLERVHPDDVDRFAAFATALAHAEQAPEAVVRLEAADGSWCHWQWSAPVGVGGRADRRPAAGGTESTRRRRAGASGTDTSDAAPRYVSARDVTAQRGAGEALVAARRQLEAILERSGSAIFAKDLLGRYILVNDAFISPLHLRREDVIGKRPSELWPGEAGDVESADLRVVTDGRVETRDEIVEVDGEARTVLTTRFPLRDASGTVIGLGAIATDITDRMRVAEALHERERLLETILRSSPDIVAVLDAKGHMLEVSDAIVTILGLPERPRRGPDGLLPEADLHLLVHPDDLGAMTAGFSDLLVSGRAPFEMLYRVRHRDGHWVALDSRGRPVPSTHPASSRDPSGAGSSGPGPVPGPGEPGALEVASAAAGASAPAPPSGLVAGAVVISRDVTAELAMERNLRQAVAEAEEASRAKSDFLSRMNHELRTPLNSVLGFAQLLALDELSESQQQAVDHILRAGRHLLDLIDEVLDISRIEAGNVDVVLEAVPLATILSDAADLIRPLAERSSISVTVEIDETLTAASLRADRQRLLQVLLNLLSNAVKYNHPAGRVEMQAVPYRRRVRIAVSDTGPGIPAANLERLFQPFDRLGAEHTQVEGTGVGLTLSKHLAEQMGGSIGVESDMGSGSTFTVELPLAGARRRPPPVRRPPSVERVAGVRRVLLVEDNLDNLALVRDVLARSGDIELLSAGDGAQALAQARWYRPDLVLLDVQLPDMLGDEVLEQLAADPVTAGIPVVVVSADATAEARLRARGLRAAAYLTKPIDVRHLLIVVDAVRPRGRADGAGHAHPADGAGHAHPADGASHAEPADGASHAERIDPSGEGRP